MFWYQQLRVQDRRTRRLHHHTQLAGLIPILVILGFMVAQTHAPGPGLWCALGLVVGFELLLTGAFRLHITEDTLSRVGRRLVEKQDVWFPLLLFVTRIAFALTLLVVVFFSIQDAVGAVALWQNIAFCTLAALVPLRRLVSELALLRESVLLMKVQLSLGHIIWALGILLVASACAALFRSTEAGREDTLTTPMIIIWIPSVLAIASFGALALKTLLRRDLPPPSRAQLDIM